jgi:hypothetical protein
MARRPTLCFHLKTRTPFDRRRTTSVTLTLRPWRVREMDFVTRTKLRREYRMARSTRCLPSLVKADAAVVERRVYVARAREAFAGRVPERVSYPLIRSSPDLAQASAHAGVR